MLYEKVSKDKRRYRKYIPYIFFCLELMLILEIFYISIFFINLGHFSVTIIFIIVYFRLKGLFQILDRQEKLKKSTFY